MIGVVIPALDPPVTLLGFVNELRAHAMVPIVIVNDGSSSQSVFRQIEGLEDVTVIHHEVNRGKGEALKSGFRHLLSCEALTTVVTVDADGQHLANDVARIWCAVDSEPDALVLGTRSLEGDIPVKSAVGNRAIRSVLKLTSSLHLGDSQTGLRALPRHLAERCLEIRASRYAFELEMLLLAKQMEITIREVAITTIYIDRNRATHFRPVLDSLRIFWVIVRFSLVSLTSFSIDIVLFAVLHYFTNAILFSTYAARISSGSFNFFCNRHVVFRSGERRSLVGEIAGYASLALLIATASGLAVQALSEWLQWSPTIVKIGVDLCLFFLSFAVQRYVIFRPTQRPERLRK